MTFLVTTHVHVTHYYSDVCVYLRTLTSCEVGGAREGRWEEPVMMDG